MQFEIRKFVQEIKALQKAGSVSGVTLSPDRVESLRARVMSGIAQINLEEPNQTKARSRKARKLELFFGYSMAAVLFFVVLGATSLSANFAVPGDWLYGLKRVKEKVALQIAGTPEQAARLQVKQAEERLEELRQISLIEETILPEEGIIMVATATPTATVTKQTNRPAVSVTTSTSSAKSLKRKEEGLKKQAQADAQKAVQAAIGSLKRVQKDLESKGRNADAKVLDSDINYLENRARSQGLNFKQQKQEQKLENQDGTKNNDQLKIDIQGETN